MKPYGLLTHSPLSATCPELTTVTDMRTLQVWIVLGRDLNFTFFLHFSPRFNLIKHGGVSCVSHKKQRLNNRINKSARIMDIMVVYCDIGTHTLNKICLLREICTVRATYDCALLRC
jgi:hypothetical protein